MIDIPFASARALNLAKWGPILNALDVQQLMLEVMRRRELESSFVQLRQRAQPLANFEAAAAALRNGYPVTVQAPEPVAVGDQGWQHMPDPFGGWLRREGTFEQAQP